MGRGDKYHRAERNRRRWARFWLVVFIVQASLALAVALWALEVMR